MTDIEKLYKRVYELEVFKKGSFTLSSGKKSNYYIDGRLISLDPSGSEKISKIFINKIRNKVQHSYTSKPVKSKHIQLQDVEPASILEGKREEEI